MNIEGSFVPLDVWAHIFSQADLPPTLACTCKGFYQIFSEISFNFYLYDFDLKERAERIQQQNPHAPYHKKISKLYKSLIRDVNHTPGCDLIKQDLFSPCYNALLSARNQAPFDNQEAKLMMSCLYHSVGCLAPLEQWLQHFNLTRLVWNLSSQVFCEEELMDQNQEKKLDIHLQQIRSWLGINDGAFDFIWNLVFEPPFFFSSLPKEIGVLTHLVCLNLANNYLSSLPKEIGKMEKLEILNLQENSLISIPKEIEMLTNLKTLNLEKNSLTRIPKEIGKLTRLDILKIGDNQLKELPEEIIELFTHRGFLDLANNQLTSLPKGIGKLTLLEVLDLEDNKLTELSEEIEQLIHLRKLYLAYNQLTSLPKGIGKLSALQVLDIENNQLTSLPKGIEKLRFLINLRIQDNLLTLLDISIWGQIEDGLDDQSLEDLMEYRHFLSLEDLKQLEALIIEKNEQENDFDLTELIESFFIQKQHLLEIERLTHSSTLSPEQIEQLRENHIRLMEELIRSNATHTSDAEPFYAILKSLRQLR